MPKTFDTLVIGAGVAGCAFAAALARQGKRVLLIERSLQEPQRIVGELLQPGGIQALSKLGLSACLEDIDAQPVKGYHIYWKDQEASFWFGPISASARRADTDGNTDCFEGRSFHHGRFVMKLREAVQCEGRITLLEATVVEILRKPETGAVIGVKCSRRGQGPTEHFADLTVLADGPCSNFRSQFAQHKPKSSSRFWGLQLLDVKLPYQGYALGVVGRGPIILIYPISKHETRILIDIPSDTHIALGTTQAVRTYIAVAVVLTLPKAIQPALVAALQSGQLRSMPNSWLSSGVQHTRGLLMLGDAWNMRHPLTGAGMTVALKDAVLLAEMLRPLSIKDADAVLKMSKRFYWKRKAHCAALNILAQALYSLFTSKDGRLDIVQRGFVRYIQGGEKNFNVPAGLMGGVVENPLLLFYYVFAIALHSMCWHLQAAEIWHLPLALCQCLLVFCRCVTLISPWAAAEFLV